MPVRRLATITAIVALMACAGLAGPAEAAHRHRPHHRGSHHHGRPHDRPHAAAGLYRHGWHDHWHGGWHREHDRWGRPTYFIHRSGPRVVIDQGPATIYVRRPAPVYLAGEVVLPGRCGTSRHVDYLGYGWRKVTKTQVCILPP